MSLSQIISTFFIALLFLFFQVYLMSHLVVYNIATPFIFFLFLFMLPLTVPAPVEFLLGFLAGLIVDIAGNSPGVNASAVLFALGAKRIFISLTGSANIQKTGIISLNNQNFVWYVSYLLVLIFIHNTAFLLEAFSFGKIGYTSIKIVSSTVYSFIINYIICITFYKK